jgi:hypothetical protein
MCEEYKQLVADYCNRIINDKLMVIEECVIDNKVELKIFIKPVEWFMELDDDLRYNIENNLFNHNIVSLLIKTKKYKKNKQNFNINYEHSDYSDYDDYQTCNKRRKIS